MFDFGSPLATELTGLNINQDDLPWWAVGILGWIGMAQSFGEGYGEQAYAHRANLQKMLDSDEPQRLYKIYDEFRKYQDAVGRGTMK